MERRSFSFQDFGIGIVTGLAIGAIAGILLAPESGESARERLVARAGDIRLSAQELVDNARNSLDLAVNRLEGTFGTREKVLRKRLGELKEELDKYNLGSA